MSDKEVMSENEPRERKKSEAMDDGEVNVCLDDVLVAIFRNEYGSPNRISGIQATMDEDTPVFLNLFHDAKPPQMGEEREAFSVFDFLKELGRRYNQEKRERDTMERLRAEINRQIDETLDSIKKCLDVARVDLEEEMINWWPATNFLKEFKAGRIKEDLLGNLESLARDWLIKREEVLAEGKNRLAEIRRMGEEMEKRLMLLNSVKIKNKLKESRRRRGPEQELPRSGRQEPPRVVPIEEIPRIIQQEPPKLNQQEPPKANQQEPPRAVQQEPRIVVQQEPPRVVPIEEIPRIIQQEPPKPNQQEPPKANQQEPPRAVQQEPRMIVQQEPPRVIQEEPPRVVPIEEEKLQIKEERLVELKCLSNDAPSELQQIKRGNSICFNQGGISRLNGTSEYAALGMDGSLALFDGLTGTLKKETKLEVKGTQYANSSIEFSPNGSHLLVSICSDKRLLVLSAHDLSVKPDCDWTRGETTSIRKARWINDETILAGYNKPGKLMAYQLGKKEPIWSVEPTDTKDSAISDFDFGAILDQKEAFCACDNSLVMRITLNQSIDFVKWKHKEHTSYVNVIRLSPDGRVVLSGSYDKRVLLTDSESGSVLSSFDGFTNNVFGAIWHPNGQMAFVSSYNELVAFKIETKEKLTLEKTKEKKKDSFGNHMINGLNGYWGDSSKNERAFLLVGTSSGHVYKCLLE